jgi:hypothetical protein
LKYGTDFPKRSLKDQKKTEKKAAANLSTKGEEALATGIHENKLIFRLRIRAIRIKPKDDFPVRIIDDETISWEEHRGLMNCKFRCLFETEFLIHHHL